MRALKLFYEQRLITHNIKPYKVVKLKTGIIAEHYINGDIKIKNESQILIQINF